MNTKRLALFKFIQSSNILLPFYEDTKELEESCNKAIEAYLSDLFQVNFYRYKLDEYSYPDLQAALDRICPVWLLMKEVDVFTMFKELLLGYTIDSLGEVFNFDMMLSLEELEENLLNDFKTFTSHLQDDISSRVVLPSSIQVDKAAQFMKSTEELFVSLNEDFEDKKGDRR